MSRRAHSIEHLGVAAALLLWCTFPGILAGWNQFADGAAGEVAIRWASLPIPYQINPSVAFGNVSAGPQTAAGAIRAAFNAWAGAAGTVVSFQDDGDTTAASGERGRNVISFVNGDFPFAGALAVTPFSYSTQTGELAGASIYFNPGVRFTTTAEPGAYDVQSIATHEIGHFIGLDHSAILGAVMYPFATADTLYGRALSSDDLAAVSTIYPAAGRYGQVGNISGTVLRASGSGGVFGAHVVATNAAGLVAASAYSGIDGRYRIRGLAPGSYSIFVEPLNGPTTFANIGSPFFSLRPDQLASNFGTTFLGSGPTIAVNAGVERAGVDVAVGSSVPVLNLRKLAVLPAGAVSVKPSATATTVEAGTPGVELIVMGDGVSSVTQFEVSGSDVRLVPVEVVTIDGMAGMRFSLAVPPEAPSGMRSIVARTSNAVSVLTGALLVTPPRGDTDGPLLTCSYDKPQASVGAGRLSITFTADEPLASQPIASVDRPGTGNDLEEIPLTATGDLRVWTLEYTVLPANGVDVSDGVCQVTVRGAVDRSGNEQRGVLNGVFVADTTGPSVEFAYSKNPSGVGLGVLTITATFSEALLRAPAIRIDRPGAVGDLFGARMSGPAGGSVFTFAYTVDAANGVSLLDGMTSVAVEDALDLAGNAAGRLENNGFVVDTTPIALSIRPKPRFEAAGVGLVPITIVASEPVQTRPTIRIDRPGTGNDDPGGEMSGELGSTSFTYSYVVLPQNGSTVLDGTASITVTNIVDGAGNASSPQTTGLVVDTQPPTATFSYSQPALAVPAGMLAVTATFNEPIALTPLLDIDRPGTGNDLPPTFMTRNGSARLWSHSFKVVQQDGVSVRDGVGSVGLQGAIDRAGNSALLPAGSVLVFDTGPAPPIATLTFGAADKGRVPAGPLRVTATFNVAPPSLPVRLTRFPPAGAAAVGPLDMSATADSRVFIADVAIPVADGVGIFDGFQELRASLAAGQPMTTIDGRFRTATLDADGLGHAILSLPAGFSFLSLPVGPAIGLRASDLVNLTATRFVARSAVTTGVARFQVHLPGIPRSDFELKGSSAYIISLPSATTLRLDGRPWPRSQLDVTLGKGANLIALPLGRPAGFESDDLSARTGASAVLLPRGWTRFLPYLNGSTSVFPLELEPVMVLLLPATRTIRLPSLE